jgi:hypothetical protein
MDSWGGGGGGCPIHSNREAHLEGLHLVMLFYGDIDKAGFVTAGNFMKYA